MHPQDSGTSLLGEKTELDGESPNHVNGGVEEDIEKLTVEEAVNR